MGLEIEPGTSETDAANATNAPVMPHYSPIKSVLKLNIVCYKYCIITNYILLLPILCNYIAGKVYSSELVLK